MSRRLTRAESILVCDDDVITFSETTENFGVFQRAITDLYRPRLHHTAAHDQRLIDQHNCNACHGAELKGQQHIPRLAGQTTYQLAAQTARYMEYKGADWRSLGPKPPLAAVGALAAHR